MNEGFELKEENGNFFVYKKKGGYPNIYEECCKIYQIRLWCSDDSCEEFWFDKELSEYFSNLEDAETELKKYEGKTRKELEAMCDVVSVRSNVPRIDEFELI
jgi:hypothetical protein